MLDVKILKVHHEGADEAKKLLPHIQQTHVYSPEYPACTTIQAISSENSWNRAIAALARVGQFRDYVEGGEGEYVAFQNESLFAQKVPIYLVERFSPDESARVIELHRLSFFVSDAAIRLFRNGNLDKYLELYRKGLQLGEESRDLRDRNIARNIDAAEAYLRKVHPHLKEDPLRLTVCLGARHQPERYTSLPVDVVSLVNSERGPRIDIKSTSSDRDLLVHAVEEIAGIKHPTALERVRQMSYDELRKLLAK